MPLCRHAHAQTHTHACIHTDTHIHIHACIHTDTHMHRHTHRHTHTQTHTQTRTHTHRHTHTHNVPSFHVLISDIYFQDATEYDELPVRHNEDNLNR